MNRIHVGAVALNQTPLDWTGNRSRISAAIAEARAAGVRLLCLPELCLTGYGCEDAFFSDALLDRAWTLLEQLTRETEGMAVSLGLPVVIDQCIYNCAALAVDGELVALVPKQHLAGDGIHYEPRWFKPWPDGEIGVLHRLGRDIPVGDLLLELDGIRIGLEICEDAWVADRPGVGLAHRGVDIILNPSASHFAFGKAAVRERFVLEGSRAFYAGYVYANLLGNEAGRVIYDGDTLIASGGHLAARGPRLRYADHTLTHAVIDVQRNRNEQRRVASFTPDFDALAASRIDITTDWPESPAVIHDPPAGHGWGKEEEFTRAVALGLYDYARKSRSRGFVLSLSGGADSAACAVLVATMLDLARQELGDPAVATALQLPADFSLADVLVTAYQATRNSGTATETSARVLAEGLGATHHRLDVDELVAGYTARVEEAIGRPLAWETDDITLQNIQARARAPGIWMFANLRNALLLATSNRSEAAVGYATMDGDTSGGLSPIGGIDKAFLRSWLRWMETTGLPETGPCHALAEVNALRPTAELRPQAADQTDEGDLMPYPILDRIEKLAIRDKKAPQEVLDVLGAYPEAADHDRDQLRAWIIRFFQLWCRNQWKRERYAPSFHLDDENLDPKTWCRFPILSGGFAEELDALT